MLCKEVDYMLNIETKELKINDKLKRKIEMIGRFTNTTPIINNGSIKNITFLVFNYSTDIYIKNLNNKIQLLELENHIKIIN